MSHHPARDRGDPPDVYAARAVPSPEPAVLEKETRAEIAVIGAGYTGLSAALHLAESGEDVVVVEAREVGWGASGRAFGQVVPYLKHGPGEILAHFGAERGQRVIDAVAAGPDLVFGLIDRHGIACDAVRTGLIFAAHTPAGQRGLEARTGYWQSRGAAVEMLDAAACEAAIGSLLYQAASLDRRGGHLNPLAYARGLAAAAARLGVRIYPNAPVAELRRDGEAWVLRVPGGVLRARSVVIGTNAYTTDFWPGLRRSVVPMRGHGLVSVLLEHSPFEMNRMWWLRSSPARCYCESMWPIFGGWDGHKGALD